MKRSEKLHLWADRERGLALMIIAGSIAAVAWSVRIGQESPTFGAAALFIAVIAMFCSRVHWQEWRRLRWLARAEEIFESRLNPRL